VVQLEFIFVADVRNGASIGLHVMGHKENGSVVIAGVLTEGLARDWNEANPKTPVRVGDSILAVNGVKGSSERILQQLRQNIELRLHIKRGGGGEGAR